jgi:hypothetical protein
MGIQKLQYVYFSMILSGSRAWRWSVWQPIWFGWKFTVRQAPQPNGGFIKGILRGVRCTKSLRVLFLHRRPPNWTTLVLYSRAVFIFNEPALRGDSITDEWSKLDLVRPMSSSATSPNFRLKPEDDGLCQTIGKNIGEIFSTTSIIGKSSYFCEKVFKSPVAQIPELHRLSYLLFIIFSISCFFRCFPASTLFSMFFLELY